MYADRPLTEAAVFARVRVHMPPVGKSLACFFISLS